MCEGHYKLKKHPYFIKFRPKYIYATLRPNSSNLCCITRGDYSQFLKTTGIKSGKKKQREYSQISKNLPNSVTRTHIVEDCSFPEKSLSIFLNARISNGIFRWTIHCQYTKSSNSCLWLGAVPDGWLGSFEECVIGKTHRSCAFMFRRVYDHLESYFYGTVDDDPEVERGGCLVTKDHEYYADLRHCIRGTTQVPDGAFVAAEVDATERTLSFFVDEKKVPCEIYDIPTPLYLGVSGFSSSFRTVSLLRLPKAASAAAQPVAFRYFRCAEENE